MEDFLKLIGPALVGVLSALGMYLKTKNERAKTKEERDDDHIKLEHRITSLETRLSAIDELRADVKNMAKTLAELVGEFRARK